MTESKLKRKDKHDVLLIGSEIKRSEVKLSQLDMFDTLTQMYSNPIAAIVREIASNAIDATVEAGKTQPVLIKLTSNKFIIQDFGIGISPERAKNYFNYGDSTKLYDYEQLGMFGLGAKCPLAYTNNLIVETISNNIKYTYLQFLDEDDIPSYTLLEKKKTKEGNGTKIIIEIKDRFDFSSFKEQIYNLRYNKFVWINIEGVSYDNDYKIYDYETFKIKSKESDGNAFILLKDIIYPLDFNAILEDPIEFPIGIKFEIGEIEPLRSRDNIKYNKKSIKIIKEKVKKVRKELEDLYKEQKKQNNQSFEELFKYYRQSSDYLKLGDSQYYYGYLNNNILFPNTNIPLSEYFNFFKDNYWRDANPFLFHNIENVYISK